MVDYFSSLPDELIFSTIQLLAVVDVVNVRCVCRRFRILVDFETLWRHFCQRDYSIGSNRVWYAWTHKEFYTKVLHKFRYLFGWWQRDLVHYGGLIKVQIEPDGIFAYDCLPPLDASYQQVTSLQRNIQVLPTSNYDQSSYHRFRHRLIFCLKPVGKQVMCFCYQSLLGHLDRIGHSPCPDDSCDNHSCTEKCHDDNMFICKTENGFKFVCHQPNRHDYNIDYWFQMEHGFRAIRENAVQNVLQSLNLHLGYYGIRVEKFHTFSKLCCYYDVTPLEMKCTSRNIETKRANLGLPKLGLYFGTYSGNGWEILDVHFNQADDQVLEGLKITGDPNVPAGKISFRIFLNKPIYLTKSDQRTIDDVAAAVIRNEEGNFDEASTINADSTQTRQYFQFPVDCYQQYMSTTPTPSMCINRFLGEGQIAGRDFEAPSFVQCILSTFDDDTFAILWLRLHTVTKFYRVIDPDLNARFRPVGSLA